MRRKRRYDRGFYRHNFVGKPAQRKPKHDVAGAVDRVVHTTPKRLHFAPRKFRKLLDNQRTRKLRVKRDFVRLRRSHASTRNAIENAMAIDAASSMRANTISGAPARSRTVVRQA